MSDDLPGYVYMIGCHTPASIKIGYTKKHPAKRLKQLQTGCPQQLVLIGWYPGSPSDERGLHESLKEFRLTGEWFRLDAGMEDALSGPMTLMHINGLLTGHWAEVEAA